MPSEVAPPPSSTGSRRSASSSPSMPARPCRGGIACERPVAERDEAEPVAAAAREMAERERDAFRDVRLPALGGAERHRGRDVEREPRHEHALGEVDAHVRLAGPRGHVPLDPAHVVPGDVRPHLGELAAGAEDRRAVVAGEQSLDPAPDRQIERAEQRLGQRAGPRPVRVCVRSPRATTVKRRSPACRSRAPAPPPSRARRRGSCPRRPARRAPGS